MKRKLVLMMVLAGLLATGAVFTSCGKDVEESFVTIDGGVE